jgi:hypothetical protein
MEARKNAPERNDIQPDADTGRGAVPHDEREDRLHRLRRYTVVVTVSLILICNAIFLLGVWGSGVNLETVLRTPDVFNPVSDICLRLRWHKVSGDDQPVRLCAEWINLSDPSGETHTFHRDTQVVKGADGNLYFDHGLRSDYRLLVFVGSVAALVGAGVAAKRRLIARYRVRLGLAGNRREGEGPLD